MAGALLLRRQRISAEMAGIDNMTTAPLISRSKHYRCPGEETVFAGVTGYRKHPPLLSGRAFFGTSRVHFLHKRNIDCQPCGLKRKAQYCHWFCGIGRRRLLRDSRAVKKADTLCQLFQQFRVNNDIDIEPAPGFYNRVLDEIAVRRKSVWLPLIYTRLTLPLAVICVFLASSALLLVTQSQRAIVTDDGSAIAELTSTRPEDRRTAVLALLLADPPVSSQAR